MKIGNKELAISACKKTLFGIFVFVLFIIIGNIVIGYLSLGSELYEFGTGSSPIDDFLLLIAGGLLYGIITLPIAVNVYPWFVTLLVFSIILTPIVLLLIIFRQKINFSINNNSFRLVNRSHL